MKRAAAILWTLLILALCSIPGGDLPEIDIVSADKIGHFVMFFGFGWLWAWAASGPVRKVALRVAVFGVVFAIGTEIYQGLLPFGRDPSAADSVANIIGLAAGLWLCSRWRSSTASAVRQKPAAS